MKLASIIHQYLPAFTSDYADRLLPGHLKAIGAMLSCRTLEAGEIRLRCTECAEQVLRPHSCGHRSCPQCQNHEASR